MSKTGLSPEELRATALDAAERMIRRHGFDKTRLVDIARDLSVSHSLLYRVFPDKAALMDAVSERWLERIDAELERIATGSGSHRSRLQNWFLTLHRLKREKVSRDPELYRAFNVSAESRRPFVVRHLANVNGQLVAMIEAAVAAGEIVRQDPRELARLLFEATLAYHHPRLVADRLDVDREASLRKLLDTLLKGLAPRHRA